MEYSVNLGIWNSVFAVPCSLVDEQLRLAGCVQLKVLLWILRNNSSPFLPEDISTAIGASAADVRDAIQYWVLTGLLTEPGEKPVEEIPAPTPVTVLQPKKEVPRRIPKPDPAFIAKRSEESADVALLMQEAQVILGKAISPGLSSSLLFLHDDCGLPVDVILMLLQYAKTKGHDNTSYIEAVGKNWSEEGISSHEAAEQKLRRLDEGTKAWTKLQDAYGISRRRPSVKEEEFASRWILEWKFSEEILRKAYDLCVNSTGKMSLSYINKVLEGWYSEGVRTVADADVLLLSKRKKKESEVRKPSYDFDELSELDLMTPTKK